MKILGLRPKIAALKAVLRGSKGSLVSMVSLILNQGRDLI